MSMHYCTCAFFQSVIWDSVIEEFKGANEKLNAVTVKNLKTGHTQDLSVAATFIAIGHDPNTQVLGFF